MSPRRPAWAELFERKPVERLPFGNGKEIAGADLYRRMIRLKEHFGIEGETGWRPWYQLAAAIAGERNPAFTIVDPEPAKGRTAARWRGAEGLALVQHVEFETEDLRAKTGKRPKREAVFETLRQLRPDTYGKLSPAHMKTAYHTARNHHQKSTKRAAK
jgi:hypothetical protein